MANDLKIQFSREEILASLDNFLLLFCFRPFWNLVFPRFLLVRAFCNISRSQQLIQYILKLRENSSSTCLLWAIIIFCTVVIYFHSVNFTFAASNISMLITGCFAFIDSCANDIPVRVYNWGYLKF